MSLRLACVAGAAAVIAVLSIGCAGAPLAPQVPAEESAVEPALAGHVRDAKAGGLAFDAAAKALRATGPEGLAAVLSAYGAERDPGARALLSRLADRVAAQRDAVTSAPTTGTPDLDDAERVAAAKRAADPLAPPAGPPRRGALVREQPLLPRRALPRRARQRRHARRLRPLLELGAAGARRDDRLRRRSQDRAHRHRQQPALRARRARASRRRDPGLVHGAGVRGSARGRRGRGA